MTRANGDGRHDDEETAMRVGRKVWFICLLLAAVTATTDEDALAGETTRPNILFIFTDDQPQNSMGCMGNQHIETPNMDQLAAEGSLFTNAFVTTAICCSNRACILTGQHMRRHAVRDFQTPLAAEAFRQTYPALLRQAGYRTGYLGKFAIGAPRPEIRELSLPADQFDFWFGFPQAINFRQQADGQVRYLTTLMEQKAVEFLRTNPPDQPFCLTVALKEPHGPWNYYDPEVPNRYADVHIPPPATFTPRHYQAQPEFIRSSLNGGSGPKWFQNPATYQEHARTFYRLITRADLALGRIRAAVEEAGLADNTVIIYSSDHGSMLGAHGLVGKWIMYEESIRVPLIIRDPRLPPRLRGRRCDEMALSIDLAPTMLALAGVPIPPSMQGRDLTPLLGDEPVSWRDDWYYEHVYNTKPPRPPIVRCEGVRTNRWKYVRYPEIEPPYEQLFDLDSDAREEHNLACDPAHAQTLGQLRGRCDEYRQSLK
jgi:arylsulfatase A-like enzyme